MASQGSRIRAGTGYVCCGPRCTGVFRRESGSPAQPKNVVIDGDLSEWDTSRCLRIDSEKQIVDQIEHWDGEADCSMEIYAMWDEENLYIAAKVWDDTPFVYREGSRWMNWMPSSSSSAPTPTPTRTVQRTKRPTGASCSPRMNMTSSTILTAT